MDTWQIIGVDPDHVEESASGVVIATVHDRRGVALARGCEAIADGWANVIVKGTFSTYPLVDPAVA
jgi:hypothetical protein